jgi:hypothetical protein
LRDDGVGGGMQNDLHNPSEIQFLEDFSQFHFVGADIVAFAFERVAFDPIRHESPDDGMLFFEQFVAASE